MKRAVQFLGVVLITFGAAMTGFLVHQWLTGEPGGMEIQVSGDPVPVVGSRRPDFTLPDLENQPRQVSEWDGKLIVINFWATWCPPCREEIPIFMSLQEEFADRGLQFIGIALQDADEVRDYVAETGMNYPVLTGYREVIKIAESLGNDIGALPYTVIINRDGVIEFTRAGPMDEPAIREALARYL